MSLDNIQSCLVPILASGRMSLESMIMVGVAGAIVVTCFTFANWRMGVKIAFVMVLFEGAIRKWVLPGAQELAYFMKDVFLIGAYLRFFFSPDMAIRSWKVKAPVGLIILCCALLSFSALNPNIGSILLGLYGIKIYLLYIPLAFMIPYLFRDQEDMMNNLFWYAMLATPICLLGVAQFAAPGYSALNVQAHGGEGFTMGWADAKIRVTGTFSFITGHTTFVCAFFSLTLALLLNKLPKWKWWMLVANLPLIVGNGFMSGSRSAVLLIVFTGAAFAAIVFFQKVGTGGNAILVLGGIAAVTVLAISLAFGEAKDQWTARWNSAKLGGETIKYRVVDMATGSVTAGIEAGGFFGLGIGMTHPAVERLRNVMRIKRPQTFAPTFDTEVGQVFVELGMIGWLSWYAMRFVMLFQSWFLFLRAPPGPLKPILLASFMIQAPHMYLAVMLNHTANFLVFACYGLSLIATLHPATVRQAVLWDRDNRNPAMPDPEADRSLDPVPSTLRGSKYSPPVRQRS